MGMMKARQAHDNTIAHRGPESNAKTLNPTLNPITYGIHKGLDQVYALESSFFISYGGFFVLFLLALSIVHRLCINLSVSRANFLTTLRSHLDVTCSYYFGCSLFNVDVNYNYYGIFHNLKKIRVINE